jgi:hypothetical protein
VAVAEIPDGLTLRRHRDLVGRERRPWTRRVLLMLLAAFLLLGLGNTYGQRPATARAASAEATLEVYAPDRVRGGVFFMARVRVEAHSELEKATLVLDPGWLEQMHLNTLEPAPVEETSRDGRLAFDFGPLAAGRSLIVFMQFQVNPTNVGRHSQDLELYDGERRLVHIDRSITVLP